MGQSLRVCPSATINCGAFPCQTDAQCRTAPFYPTCTGCPNAPATYGCDTTNNVCVCNFRR